MEYKEIKRIFEKFRDKNCTEQDMNMMFDCLYDPHNKKIIKKMMLEELENYDVEDAESKNMDFDALLGKIESKIIFPVEESKPSDLEPKQKRGFMFYLTRVAAAFLIFMAGVAIVSLLNISSSDVAYFEIKAPLGAKTEIALPDGSYVWLNAGSSIKYQDFFNKKNRNIHLEGEAYFKVAQKNKLPFIVETGELNIIATGTEFNVKAYLEEGTIETTLIEGKVTIKNLPLQNSKQQQVFLEPKQVAIYVKSQQEMRVEDFRNIKELNPQIIPESGTVYIAGKVDTSPIVSWKDNKLVFKGEKLSSLAIKLERKYNVKITFDNDKIMNFRISGSLEDETLQQILDVIKLTVPIDYKLEGKLVTIYENPKMMQQFSQHLK